MDGVNCIVDMCDGISLVRINCYHERRMLMANPICVCPR